MTKQSNKRKFLATTLTATMVAAAVAPVAGAAAADTKVFPDVPADHNYAGVIADMAAAGIVKGETNGNFNLGGHITRAEAAQMVAGLLSLKTGAEANRTDFTDVKGDVWYTGAINSLVNAGVIAGVSEKTFAPNENITRGQIAQMLVVAYDLEDVNVDDVVLPFTDVADDAWYAKPIKILYKEGLINGRTATTFEPKSDMTRGDFTWLAANVDYVHGDKLPKDEDAVEAAVVGVSAINAEELLVTFNKEVTKETANEAANYEVEKNGAVLTGHKVTLQKDGKTAIIRIDVTGSKTAFTAGDKIVTQVKDGVKATDGQAIERFKSEVEVYSLAKAPQLVELKLVPGSSNDGKIEATFDRPVDNLATTLVKIDGLALADKTFALQGAANPGNYTYEVDIASGAEYNLASKVGKHEVVIFDVAETAVNNPAVNTTINTSYEVVADVTAPVVQGVEAVNANKFFVEFSEAIKLDAIKKNSITVKKGNLTFPTVDAATVTGHNTGTAETYVGAPTYRNGKPGVYVVVNDTAANASNPLYKDNESAVTLDVTVENYKDNVDLLGSKYNGTVKLSKGTATPKVDKTVVNPDDKSLEVLFDAKLGSAPTAANLVVKDKDGVIVPTASVTPAPSLINQIKNDTNTYTGQVVKIQLAAAYQDRAPYTVTFKEDAVKYDVDSSTIDGYSIEANGNKELDVTVGKASDSNAKYHAFNGTVALDGSLGKNVIKVTYGTEMDAATSRDIRNYTLDGKALPTGTKLDFYSDKKVIILTLPEETISRTTDYKFSINPAVKTEKGQSVVKDLQTLAAFDQTLTLTDNVRPTLAGAEYLVGSTNATTSDEIIVKFSENIANADAIIAGTDLSVIVNDNTIGVEHIQNGKAGDEYAIIKLAKEVNVSQAATISVKTDVVKDKNSVLVDGEGLHLNASTVTASTKTLDAQGNGSTVAAPGAPTPGKTDASTAGGTDGTITSVDNTMEYKLASASTWTDITGSSVTGLAAGKYEVRVKAGSTLGAPAGAIANVTIQNPAPTAPTNLGFTGTVATSDATITGLNDTMEYKLGTDSTWTSVPASATSVTVTTTGQYDVRVKASTDGLTPAGAVANVTAN